MEEGLDCGRLVVRDGGGPGQRLSGAVEATTARSRQVAVAIRLRPIQASEKQRGGSGIAWVAGQNCIVDQQSLQEMHFNHVFGPEVETRGVYEACVGDVIRSFCSGVNGAVFAYGQTASGKTFTMQGDGEGRDGIVQMVVADIFHQIMQRSEREFIMSVAYLEIYKEQVFDLRGDGQKEIRVCEDHAGETKLDGLLWTRVGMPQDIYECLREGNHHRHIGDTKMNERSSRSHTVLRIRLESRALDASASCFTAVLDLVDLAGSEGLRQTESTGLRRLEAGASTNRSCNCLRS